MTIRFRFSVIARKLVMESLSSWFVRTASPRPAGEVRRLCQNRVRTCQTALTQRQAGQPSENARRERSGRDALLSSRNTARRFAAALWAVALCLTSLSAPASAQDQVQPMGPQEALRVWGEVERWVREWSVPDQRPINLPPVNGAAITLRYGGVLLAATTMVGDEDVLLPLVREAIAEATDAMPFDRDIFFQDKLADASARVSIGLEIAGALVPMAEETDFERELGTNPGLDGVAIRYEGEIAAMSPGIMLAQSATPDRMLNILRGRLLADKDPSLALEPDRMRGASYYRFRMTHLSQADALSTPIFLHRGGRVIPLTTVDKSMLQAFADDMATYLERQAWPGIERYGMYGPMNAVRGRADTVFAGPLSQGLTAWALFRYASTPGVDPVNAERAKQAAAKILTDLSVVEDGEVAPSSDSRSAAMCLIAVRAAERRRVELDEGAARLGANCRRVVWESFSMEFGFAPGIVESAYGLLSHAMVRSAISDEERRIATAAVRATYQITPLDQLSLQMPWLGWAELSLAGEGVVPAAVALRDMREGVWRDQFTPADASFGDEDLVGGIVLLTGGGNPLPSWHTARRVAILATMLGDNRLTEPGEVGIELVTLLRSLRFLRQLSVDDAVAHMCRNAVRVKGGIRSSLWDQSMPADATAFSLLAVTETLRSLERF